MLVFFLKLLAQRYYKTTSSFHLEIRTLIKILYTAHLQNNTTPYKTWTLSIYTNRIIDRYKHTVKKNNYHVRKDKHCR